MEPPIRIEQLAAAWQWVLRLREDGVSQDDLTDWLRWYAADEVHKAAFEAVQAFWSNAEQATEGPGAPSVSELLGGAAVVIADRAAPTRNRNSLFTRWAAFAAAALAAIAFAGWWAYRPSANVRTGFLVQPQIAVQRTTLPDGSRIELAPRSSVALHFTDRERALELADGEAYFSVAHNRQRPFVVTVAQLHVRAIGTAFNIRKAAARVVVSVTEGTVEVLTSSEGTSARTRVTAGHQATWEAGSSVPTLVPAAAAQALAWQQGRLEYINEPLSAVIADVNRYSLRSVVILDESVGRITFSGTVFTDATDVWLRALPSVFPVELRSDAQGALLLTRDASR